ncbi:MAG TPA: L-aspartate oxidase [Thermoanaerobaculia bacterium]|nr:L-aspartate oxidase [Thermoanaerobaculia bacterium]
MSDAPGCVLATDVVVVGTGVAGLTAALGAAAQGLRVHLLTKTELVSGSSPWAQGGVAAAVGRGDSPELHAADTVAAGAGLVDPEVADIVTRDGVLAVERLVEIGAEFDRGQRGELSLGREAAHSRRRILHARGDATGAEIVRALAARVAADARISLVDRAYAERIELVDGRAGGLVVRHRDGTRTLHAAPRIVLATGGLGQLYRATTNPLEATADGLWLAAAAGARLVDVEFVQFHPTALAVEADPLPLLTEALRGEGATLLDERGTRFMPGVDPAAELAPRDVVARAIWERLAAGGRVFLDGREAPGERFPRAFPQVFEVCRSHGLDPRRDLLPVVPAAHYHMGGVAVDDRGRASLTGLWACGEVASTGVHGANRLASNSLLEALVFGARVAESMNGLERPRVLPPAPRRDRGEDPRERDRAIRAAARALASERLGVIRDQPGLELAVAGFAELWRGLGEGASEARSLVAAGALIAAAALRRRESRGSHARRDFPEADEAWRFRQFLTAAIAAEGVEARFEARAERREATL